MPADEEARSLLAPKDSITLLGTKFSKNGYPWHMVIVFVNPGREDTKSKFQEPFPKPRTTWEATFTGVNGTGKLPVSIKDDTSVITRKQFADAVFKEIVKILSGSYNSFELETMQTIDADEVFLMVALKDKKAKEDLADAEEFFVKLTTDVYIKANEEVPTDKKVFDKDSNDQKKKEKGRFEVIQENEDDGAQLSNQYPIYMPFRGGPNNKYADKYEPLGELDCIRMVKRRIKKFIDVDTLIEADICRQRFPVHHWDEGVNMLHRKGFNDLTKMLHWPYENRSDVLNGYFGPEIAFFFHWFDLLTRYLAFPGFISVGTYTCRWISKQSPDTISREDVNFMSMGFASMLIIWSSVFTAKYNQMKNMKQMKWGMVNLTPQMSEVRRQFKDSYRDSFRDYAQHFFHYSLVAFFILETIGVVIFCSHIQVQAREHPDETFYGISNEHLTIYPKYIITVNIKLVDKVWTILSNKLTKMENWRTVQEMQENMVYKMFLVKMFVFYYPFLYEILIKPMTRGCGPEGSHTDLRGCVDTLNTNLIAFFITQCATEMALVLFNIGMVAWYVSSERKKYPEKEYTYLELQAKCAPYTEDDLASDFLNAVVTYGYIVLFGVSLPFMCFLGFATNFIMKRLLAFKISYTFQRPMPKTMDGIGAWQGVVQFLSYVGVLFNGYIALFTLRAFHDLEFNTKLLLFIVVENVGFAIKVLVEGLIGNVATPHARIVEHNSDILDKLLDDEDPIQIRKETPSSTVESPFEA